MTYFSQLEKQLSRLDEKLDSQFDQLAVILNDIKEQILSLNQNKGSSGVGSILGPSPFTTKREELLEAQRKLDRSLQVEATSRAVVEGLTKQICNLADMDKSHFAAKTQGNQVDFPKFDGFNTRAWVIKCDIYFKITDAVSDENKMKLAMKNFEGKALMLIQTLGYENILRISWEQFIEVVAHRFEELDERNIIMNFMNLRQIGSYDDDVEKYEQLRACLLLNGVSYFEEFLVASFIHGLSHEVQGFMVLPGQKDLQNGFESEQNLISTKRETEFSGKVQGQEFYFSPGNLGNDGHVLVLDSEEFEIGTLLDYMRMNLTVCFGGRKVKFRGTKNDDGFQLISTEGLFQLDFSEEFYFSSTCTSYNSPCPSSAPSLHVNNKS